MRIKSFLYNCAILSGTFWNIVPSSRPCCRVTAATVGVVLSSQSSSGETIVQRTQTIIRRKRVRCHRPLPEICLNRNHDEEQEKKETESDSFLFAFDHRRRAHLVITSSLLLPRMILLFGAEAAAAVSARSSRPPTHPSQKEITDDSVTNTPPHAVAPFFSAKRTRQSISLFTHLSNFDLFNFDSFKIYQIIFFFKFSNYI